MLLVSIAPYQYLTEQIAGDDFTVYVVVPPNANPHSFEPTSSQTLKIGQALIWFQMGEPFEKKILPVLQSKNPSLVTKDLRDGIPMIGEGCCSVDQMDRHIWLSPRLAAVQAVMIEEVLSQAFPEYASFFKENLAKLTASLAALDSEIHEELKKVENRSLLVSHPAFGYFCKEYGFTQLSVEYEGKDPKPQDLARIRKQAERDPMELALALPQYNNKGVQLIAKEVEAAVHFIDPYSPDYFKTMRTLSTLIQHPHDNCH